MSTTVPWHVPQANEFPTAGPAYEWLTKTSGLCASRDPASWCLGMSDEYSCIPVEVNPESSSAVLNPHQIASYAQVLAASCYENGNVGGSCTFLTKVLSYLETSKKSPRMGLDVWHVHTSDTHDDTSTPSLPDAMVQSAIALLFQKVAANESDPKTKKQYVDRMRRAGNAFDWAYGNGGVAHDFDDTQFWYIGAHPLESNPRYALNVMAKALNDLHDLGKLDPEDQKWELRVARGLNMLCHPDTSPISVASFHGETFKGIQDWSRHRVRNVRSRPASCGYHRLNLNTLTRLISRNRDRNSVLQYYRDLWVMSYAKAAVRKKCDPLPGLDYCEDEV